MGGYKEELYIALYEHALTKYLVEKDGNAVIGDFFNAHTFRPERLEAISFIVNHYHSNKKYKLAYDLGKPYAEIKSTKDKLYVQYKLYKYKFKLIMGMCAFHCDILNDSIKWFSDISPYINEMEENEKILYQHFFTKAKYKNLYILKKYGINNFLKIDKKENKRLGVIIAIPEEKNVKHINRYINLFTNYKKSTKLDIKIYFSILNNDYYDLTKIQKETPGLVYNYLFNKYKNDFDYVCFIDYLFTPFSCFFDYHDDVSLCHQKLLLENREIVDNMIINGAVILSNDKFEKINGFQNNSYNHLNDIPFLLGRCNDLNIGWKRRDSIYTIAEKDYKTIKSYRGNSKLYSFL